MTNFDDIKEAITMALEYPLIVASVCISLYFTIGCTSDAPRMTELDDTTIVQTDTRVLGVKVATKTDVVKSQAQKMKDLDIKKAERQQDIEIRTEERQSKASFWLGVVMFAASAACVIIGYACAGWKFWGGLATICAAIASSAWMFEHLTHYLKYAAIGLAGVIVLWTMHKLKDFSVIDKIRKDR